MEVLENVPARRLGRPLSFNREAALDAAMHLFWRHGYEGASIATLTRHMKITPPSLYAAFGDKRRLFRECIDRYLGGDGTVTDAIANAPTARQATRDLLFATVLGNTGDATPPGCLLASSIVSCSSGADDIREELAAIRREIEGALRLRIGRDVAEGVLPPDTDAEMLAGHAFAIVQGLSTLAKDGADRAKLLKIIDGAMRCWPSETVD